MLIFLVSTIGLLSKYFKFRNISFISQNTWGGLLSENLKRKKNSFFYVNWKNGFDSVCLHFQNDSIWTIRGYKLPESSSFSHLRNAWKKKRFLLLLLLQIILLKCKQSADEECRRYLFSCVYNCRHGRIVFNKQWKNRKKDTQHTQKEKYF